MLDDRSHATRAEQRRSTEGIPLVSFVVINHNYGRFLRQCVASVFAQDYPHFECVVIDNASTDDSADVIADLQAAHPDLVVRINAKNLDQIGAARQGYELSSGLFVSFIDADDYLLPHYAKTHVLAHMLADDPLAFTSGDMIELVDDAMRAASVVNGYLKQRYTWKYAQRQRLPVSFLREWAVERRTKLKLRGVKPHTTHWVWSPTSGTMYRREAVSLFIFNPDIAKLRLNLDSYLNFALNALSGSLLIEEAVAVYRVHDANNFARHGQMQHLFSFDTKNGFGSFATYCALEYMTHNYEVFDRRVYTVRHLYRVMDTLAKAARQKSWIGDTLRELSRPLFKRYWRLRLRRVLPYVR